MKNKGLYLFIILLVFYSCVPEEDQIDMTLVENKLKEESYNYLKLRLFNCREEIMRDAEDFVDSIMVNEINFDIGGSLLFPNRPNKPGYIGKIQLNDSTKPLPFINLSALDLPITTSILDTTKQ